MEYKIRKGLETKCQIKGMLSSDYWILVGFASAVTILFLLGIRTGVLSGDWNQSLLMIVLLVVGMPLLIHKFREKARNKKFDEKKAAITISNMPIYKTLTKQKTDEHKRDIQHT